MTTPMFKYLDICNYISPGTAYEKWVKTYGAKLSKSWLPYDWFDCADLPSCRCWFSKLKNKFVLSPEEYGDCQCVFREQRMRTFADWLGYYNSPDVVPFLEALESMQGFYTELGIDLFKDAVSLPGVSMEYLLQGTLNQKIRFRICTP